MDTLNLISSIYANSNVKKVGCLDIGKKVTILVNGYTYLTFEISKGLDYISLA